MRLSDSIGEPLLFVSDSKILYLVPIVDGTLTEYACAYCGELNETLIDLSGGSKQVYTEDCAVCCRPNVLNVQVDIATGGISLEANVEE